MSIRKVCVLTFTLALTLVVGALSSKSVYAEEYRDGDVWIDVYGNTMPASMAKQWTYQIVDEGVDLYSGTQCGPAYNGKLITVSEYPEKERGIVGFVPAIINGRPVVALTNTFMNMSYLTIAPKLPSTVKTMDTTFFCTNIKEVEIPSGVTSLRHTFNGAELTEVNIPQGVRELLGTFTGCNKLTKVNIPDGVTDMYFAFSGAENLTEVNIPEGVTRIDCAFQFTNLSSVSIPDSVIHMCCAFAEATKLTSANIPKNVEYMSYAFKDTSLAGEVTIPDTMKYMEGAFDGTSRTITMKYNPDNEEAHNTKVPSNVTKQPAGDGSLFVNNAAMQKQGVSADQNDNLGKRTASATATESATRAVTRDAVSASGILSVVWQALIGVILVKR